MTAFAFPVVAPFHLAFPVHDIAAVERITSPVDGHDVPVPHFGVILPWDAWEQLSERLKAADWSLVIKPYVRFAGQTGEDATMFFLDVR